MNQLIDASIALLLHNIFLAFLLIGVSIPLVQKKVHINTVYGFRFKAAFKDEQTWFLVNAYGGKRFISASLGMLFLCGVLGVGLYWGIQIPLVAYIATLLMPIIWAVWKTFRYARSLE